MQEKWDDCLYGDITLKKADKIKTMFHLAHASSIDTEKVFIDPNNMFHGFVIVRKRMQNLCDCFTYELAPYSMSLFHNDMMRKPENLIYITTL